MIIFLIILVVVLFGLLCTAAIVINRMLRREEAIEDRLNDSMEVLNAAYEQINEILQRPLFYNSPEVRTVVEQVKYVREAIHAVAVEVAGINEENVDDSEEQEDSDE
jgi:hypothetical protein